MHIIESLKGFNYCLIFFLRHRHTEKEHSQQDKGNRKVFFNIQALVVQTLDSTIHELKIYPVDNAFGFPNTYPVDSTIQWLNNRAQVLTRDVAKNQLLAQITLGLKFHDTAYYM